MSDGACTAMRRGLRGRLERRFRRAKDRAADNGGFVIFEATKDRVMREHFGPSSDFGLDDIEIVLDIVTEPMTQELAECLIAEGFPRGPRLSSRSGKKVDTAKPVIRCFTAWIKSYRGYSC